MQIFEVGEWVKMSENASSWKSIGLGSVGVVQGIGYVGDQWDGTVFVGFCGEQDQWVGPITHLQRVDKLMTGKRVRVKHYVKQPRFGWSGHSHTSDGTISAVDADGKLRIYTPYGSKAWMLDPSEVELVEDEELRIGDWVKARASVSTPTHQWGDVTHLSIGVVHRIEDGDLWVAFCFVERLWLCKACEMERVRPFKVGDKVRIREGLVTPRRGWGMETHASKGQIVGVDANGKLRIKFQWREGKPWILISMRAHLVRPDELQYIYYYLNSRKLLQSLLVLTSQFVGEVESAAALSCKSCRSSIISLSIIRGIPIVNNKRRDGKGIKKGIIVSP